MEMELRSLKGLRRMPVPNLPFVKNYGGAHVGADHDVQLFPAILRESAKVKIDPLVEAGTTTCFFHEKLPASAVCEVSGRMICDLCKTEWKGQTVSFEALQSLVGQKGKRLKGEVATKWDSIALVLALLPLIMWFTTIATAPVALGICLWKWRAGPTSVLRKSRWRYVLAGLIASAEIVFWVWFLIFGMHI